MSARRATVALAALPVAVLLLAAQPAPAPGGPEVDPAALERARAAAGELTSSLQARLGTELASGGASAAIAVCSKIAPELAASISKDGVSVHRVTTRPRNPAARPDEVESRALETFAGLHAAGELPAERWEVTGEPPARELRYFRPLVIQPVCLRCHGERDQLDPAVRESLAALYPQDAAVGYAVGDLRGAVSVRVALP